MEITSSMAELAAGIPATRKVDDLEEPGYYWSLQPEHDPFIVYVYKPINGTWKSEECGFDGSHKAMGEFYGPIRCPTWLIK